VSIISSQKYTSALSLERFFTGLSKEKKEPILIIIDAKKTFYRIDAKPELSLNRINAKMSSLF